MSEGLLKRSIQIAGHATSVSLEQPFWAAVKEIAQARGTTIRGLIAEIDAGREEANLSSAIRIYVLRHYQARGGSAE